MGTAWMFVDPAVAAPEVPALAVSPLPELEVLETVVGPVAIDVMNGFLGSQRPPDAASHDEAMLHHVPIPVAHRQIWSIGRIVVVELDEDVTIIVGYAWMCATDPLVGARPAQDGANARLVRSHSLCDELLRETLSV